MSADDDFTAVRLRDWMSYLVFVSMVAVGFTLVALLLAWRLT